MEQIENKLGTNYRRTPVNQVDQHMRKSLRSKDGLVFYPAHNPKVVSSNLTPATNCYCKYNGLGASTPEPFFFSVQLASKTPHTASPSCAATRFPSSLITWV